MAAALAPCLRISSPPEGGPDIGADASRPIRNMGLGPTPMIDWKLGSQRQVEDIFTRGKPGLKLVPLAKTPDGLSSKNWDYHEVTRDNEAWRDVQLTETLAMRFTDTIIANRNSLEGSQQLIVKYKGKDAELRFALFAVRTDA